VQEDIEWNKTTGPQLYDHLELT